MTIYRDLSLCHPKFRAAATALHHDLIRAYKAGETETLFQVFETYRLPMRQDDLIMKKVTKAGPFESAHQFGLAADFVPYLSAEEAFALGTKIGERVLPGWNWHSSHDYRFLATRAEAFELSVPIPWDPCHIQSPGFNAVLTALRRIP